MSGMQTSLTMEQYLVEIQYSATSLLDIVWRDHAEVHQLAHRLAEQTKKTADGYSRANAIALNANDPDDLGMATSEHWDTYFGADKDRHHTSLEHDKLAERIEVRKFSVSATAGAVLQVAKQGISIVHSGLQPCPDGRTVATSQTLKNVVWQGRNQAIHWEEGALHPPVTSCFDALAAEHDTLFSNYYRGSLAFEVLNLLNWRTWDAFRADLESLA